MTTLIIYVIIVFPPLLTVLKKFEYSLTKDQGV